jgi:hypothetical protein
MTQATSSQIAMWRAAIALVWSDHRLEEGEKERLTQFFENNRYLSEQQKATLKNDLATPIALDDVWKDITEKQDRAQLIDILPTLFHSDGSYTEDEKSRYQQVLNDHMSTLDVGTATEIAKMAEESRKNRAKEESDFINGMNKAEKLLYLLDKKLFG